jgi:plasmid segregation protein ParM
MTTLISVDIGNGYTKAAANGRQLLFPSVVGREQGAITFETGLSGRASQLTNLVITYEGERYAIGYAAERLARMQTVEMGRGRVSSDTYKRLFAAALAATIEDSGNLVVIASLPVEWYNGAREEARRTLAGVWSVGYQDEKLTYVIDQADLHIVPEGFGAICSLVLDSKGRSARSDLAGQRIGVVDIGTRTTDYLYFDALQLYPNRSGGSDQVGVSVIWTMLKEQINLEYGRSLNSQELDQALHTGRITVGSQEVDINDMINSACRAMADTVRAEIGTLWQGGKDVQAIILTGGGAPLVYSNLDYRHATLVADPVWANVIGAYQFALYRGLNGSK